MILSRVLQFLISCLGILFLVWAFSDPRFRDAEGFLKGGFCLPLAVGLGLITLAWGVTGRLKKFAFWFALALVGQAVALQMIEAGQLIRYQHYKPLNLLAETDPLLLLFLAMQTMFVIIGLKNRWSEIRAWLSHTVKTWKLLMLGLVFILSSAAVQREIPLYLSDLFIAALVQTVSLINIVLIAWTFPEEMLSRLKQRLDRLFRTTEKEPSFNLEKEGAGKPKILERFAVFAAIWVLFLAAVLNVFSYERHPHVPDEVVYLYHARFLAEGVITLPAPPVPDAFDIYLMEVKDDRWYPSTHPGWPAILSLGVRLGVPWLVNPLLAGLNVLLIYYLLWELYDRRTARVGVFLLCISPWYIFMAMNFMTHTFTLTCALVATVGIIQARKTGKARWGWLAGLMVGVVSLTRPLEGLVLAGLLGLWAIGVGGRRLKVTTIMAFVLGTIFVGATILPYNKLLTGSQTVFPLNAYIDKHYGPGRNDFGFGPNRGLGWGLQPFPGHSPLGALINANLNIFSLNIELFGWSTGSLLLILLLVFAGMKHRSDYLMVSVIASFFGAHIFYWFSGGPDFGARYWYLMLVPCIALAVGGIRFIEKTFESGSGGSSDQSTRIMVAVLSMCIFTLVNYFPWRAIDKYHHYLRMRPDIRYLAKDYGFGKSLVLIRGDWHPDYESAAAYNPLDLHTDAPVYAWDRNPEARAQLLSAYSDRQVWIVDGPSLTRGGFKVNEGPLSTRILLAQEHGVR